MNPTLQNPNADYFNPGQGGNPMSSVVAPVVPTTINASQMATPTQALQFAPTPQPEDLYGTMSAIPTVDQVQQNANIAMNQPATAAETQQNSLREKLMGALQKFTGKGAAQLEAEKTSNLPQYQTQLTDINSQIQGLQKEMQAVPLREDLNSVGRRGVQGTTDAVTRTNRENTIKALGLSSIAQTLQGNIANAQRTADRAIEVEFAPLQAEIDLLSKTYEMNKDTLTRQDKKRTEALELGLKERQRLLDDRKEDKKIAMGFAAEAAKNGANTMLINQAIASGDSTKALSILSGFMSDPDKKAQAIADLEMKRAQIAQIPLENSYKQAQIDNINAKTKKKLAENTSNPKGTVISGGLTYTPQDAAEDSKALEASRTNGSEADGKYVDPSLYQKLYGAWISNGGLLKDFLSKYPPAKYVNPANTWLPPFLMPAKSGTSSTKSTSTRPK